MLLFVFYWWIQYLSDSLHLTIFLNTQIILLWFNLIYAKRQSSRNCWAIKKLMKNNVFSKPFRTNKNPFRIFFQATDWRLTRTFCIEHDRDTRRRKVKSKLGKMKKSVFFLFWCSICLFGYWHRLLNAVPSLQFVCIQQQKTHER